MSAESREFVRMREDLMEAEHVAALPMTERVCWKVARDRVDLDTRRKRLGLVPINRPIQEHDGHDWS